jgi:hypothetical protein
VGWVGVGEAMYARRDRTSSFISGLAMITDSQLAEATRATEVLFYYAAFEGSIAIGIPFKFNLRSAVLLVPICLHCCCNSKEAPYLFMFA